MTTTTATEDTTSSLPKLSSDYDTLHHQNGSNSTKRRPRVALIGCGASGMCVLNALMTRWKRGDEEPSNGNDSNDDDCTTTLPFITCFEQAAVPGGCWRTVPPDERSWPMNEPVWYDTVWSNVCKECFEFSNYTYQDHFGKTKSSKNTNHDENEDQQEIGAVPTFLPRKELLDYFISRILQTDPTLLDSGLNQVHGLHEIRYSTVVTNVSYDETTQLFTVQTAPHDPTIRDKKHQYTPVTTEEYDYCIWAAGIRGRPRIPRSLLELLKLGQSMVDKTAPRDEPFKGTILHSIHAASEQLPSAVANKKVVLVGDSDSAVDMALQIVKLGAQKVHILSRSGYGDAFYMGSWPKRRKQRRAQDKEKEEGKLDSHAVKDKNNNEHNPVSVTPAENNDTQQQDDDDSSSDDSSASDDFEPIVEVHVAMPIRITNQGTSIECAPVSWNHFVEVYQIDEEDEFHTAITIDHVDTVIFCTGYVPNTTFLTEDLQLHSEELFSWCWSAPPDFVMRENVLTPEFGHIVPSTDLGFSGNFVPGVYRSVLISNPKMMYIMDINSEYPLLHLEAEAWQCLAFCTGDLTLPPQEVMDMEIQTQMLEEMNIAFLRWSVDPNYFEALYDLQDPHWTDDLEDPRTIKLNEEYLSYYVGLLARNFRDAKYPIDLGTYGALTELGMKLVQLGMENVKMRHMLDPDSEDATWKTFRDVTTFSPRVSSIYTGQVAAPMPKPWLEWTADDTLRDVMRSWTREGNGALKVVRCEEENGKDNKHDNDSSSSGDDDDC